MRKFTIFTFILTVLVVVVVAELFINNYLPSLVRTKTPTQQANMELTLPDKLNVSNMGGANVLGADVDYSKIPNPEPVAAVVVDPETIPALPVDSLPALDPTVATPAPVVSDFENENFAAPAPKSVSLREDHIRSAGFANSTLSTETGDGYLYKTIYVADLTDVELSKYLVKTGDTLLAKVYVLQIGALSDPYAVYEVLKSRAADALNIKVNETNQFAQASFYMNDSKRPDAVFLTVRIGSSIYGFSYPKEYHAQIKNLILLLDKEF